MPHRDLIIDGIKYPSVTEVLSSRPKPWLDAWHEKWGRRAEQKAYEATLVGRRFHEGVDAMLSASPVTPLYTSVRLAKMWQRFKAWVLEVGFEVKETELHVISHKYTYQGTFDATGYLRGGKELYLFDWKTSSGIYADMALQLSAYAQAYYEQTGIRIKKGLIVHISKDKPGHKLSVKEYALGKRLFNKFLKRLEEYRRYHK
jgi:hypothetical protein